uniref:Uncharacterized protein n=1 Tax=Mimiviridae sp. ChoanoV1 TaxID=2596887 RepID=A0A5B8IFL4_9VIRU|nr:hypothetical protein 1_182 [Mimiviridae sp. ChoanoV1]
MNQLSKMLETNSEEFILLLKDKKMVKIVQFWIDNCKNYHNYHSPILIQLLLLVGDKNEYWVKQKPYFGDNIDISNKKGIEIFYLLMDFNHNLNDTDYYGKSFQDKILLYEKGEHIRKNNLEFINHVKRELGY